MALSATWDQVVDEVEQRHARVTATVLIDADVARYLVGQFGRLGSRTGDAADGRAVVEVAGATPRMLAERLAGWGALVDVASPDGVRRELARIGAELVAGYGHTDVAHHPGVSAPVNG